MTRGTLAGCRVTVHEHLDDTLSITFEPHVVGRYQTGEAVEMTPPRKATKKRRFPQRLGKVRPKSSLTFPHSHSHYYWLDI
jgi:hypothetical protein